MTVPSINNIPIPDPSVLTTEQLRRELDKLQELIYSRMDAMERAAEVLDENVNRQPTILDREMDKLNLLTAERFNSIAVQFKERDVRTDQDKLAATTAVNAALQAQKEAAGASNISNSAAIAKSEAGFTKEIDAIKNLLLSNKDGINTQITDLVARLNRSEAAVVNTREVRVDRHSEVSGIMGIVGGIVGVVSLVAMLLFGILNSVHTAGAPTPIDRLTVQQPNATGGIGIGTPSH